MGPLAEVKHCTRWFSPVASTSLGGRGKGVREPSTAPRQDQLWPCLCKSIKAWLPSSRPLPTEHKDFQVVTSQQALEKQLVLQG